MGGATIRNRFFPLARTLRRTGLLAAVGVALIAPPAVLSQPLFDAALGVTRYLSPDSMDNAGNSTGILLSSALVSLMWLRRDRSFGVVALLAVLGVAAGAGA